MAYIDLKKQQLIPIEYEKGNSISFSAYNFIDIFQEKMEQFGSVLKMGLILLMV